jgi:hypothetical protein
MRSAGCLRIASVTTFAGEAGDVPNSVELGRAVAAIDVATRLSVVRQDSGYAVDLMCAQIAR